MEYETEQERFWAGDFGTQYTDRNAGRAWIAANTRLFAQVLARTNNVNSVIEFGANQGLNLRAIDILRPDAQLAAVEINAAAAQRLRDWGRVEVFEQSILEFDAPRSYNLALIKGVLIHINPDQLSNVYDKLYSSSSRYICIVEYYNPTPIMLSYRGHENRLFKRDFAGELLDRFPNLLLVDYGFLWRRDPNFPQDDVTWFLLEKCSARATT